MNGKNMMHKIERAITDKLIRDINEAVTEPTTIMEVCGTHTQMIAQLGLRSILSPKIRLISGPGCPVCVTDAEYIDQVLAMLHAYSITICCFGDMVRVPGSKSSLSQEKARGKDVRIVYSPFDAIDMAKQESEKSFVFLAVGFETTAPIFAQAIKTVREHNIKNLFFLTSIKQMPPVLQYILNQPDCRIDGLLCPGHVAVITGAEYFRFITDEYDIPAAVCGFEAVDILSSIYFLCRHKNQPAFLNRYSRAVSDVGNARARDLMDEIFITGNTFWRGIGFIEASGMSINDKYSDLDAAHVFPVIIPKGIEQPCQCGEILLGKKESTQCKLFGISCNPQNPMGPCMVSSEGACATAYRFQEEII